MKCILHLQEKKRETLWFPWCHLTPVCLRAQALSNSDWNNKRRERTVNAAPANTALSCPQTPGFIPIKQPLYSHKSSCSLLCFFRWVFPLPWMKKESDVLAEERKEAGLRSPGKNRAINQWRRWQWATDINQLHSVATTQLSADWFKWAKTSHFNLQA